MLSKGSESRLVFWATKNLTFPFCPIAREGLNWECDDEVLCGPVLSNQV